MSDLFERAVRVVLNHEGGLSDDPDDPGGITKYGISLRAFPHLGREVIRNLTVEQAKQIYKQNWWDRYGYERLPADVAIKVFDLAVNMGPAPAHKLLQQALCDVGQRVPVDGVIGPQTVAAAQAAPKDDLLRALRWRAVLRYLSLVEQNPTLRKFLQGWLRRAVY